MANDKAHERPFTEGEDSLTLNMVVWLSSLWFTTTDPVRIWDGDGKLDK